MMEERCYTNTISSVERSALFPTLLAEIRAVHPLRGVEASNRSYASSLATLIPSLLRPSSIAKHVREFCNFNLST